MHYLQTKVFSDLKSLFNMSMKSVDITEGKSENVQLYLWQLNRGFLTTPQDISTCVSGDQNRCFKLQHDLFLTLTKGLCAELNRITSAVLTF